MSPHAVINKLEQINQKSKLFNVGQIEDGAKKNYFSLFPDEEILHKRMPNSFIINKPMNGVGGDGYWHYEVDNFIYLAVFDCMGHGHLASMMTRIYTNVLKKVVVEKGTTIPGSILQEMHDEVQAKFSNSEGKQLHTGADFGIIRINTFLKEMEFAGARMDLMEVNKGQINAIKADKLQVGEMFDYEHEYQTTIIDLRKHKDSNYYLFSDGVKDLIGGPSEKKLGSKKVKEILENNYVHSMKDQKKIFTDFLDDWAGSNMQLDDVLMIGFRADLT